MGVPLADKDCAGSNIDPDVVLSKQHCKGADKELMEAMNIPSRVSADLLRDYKMLLKQYPPPAEPAPGKAPGAKPGAKPEAKPAAPAPAPAPASATAPKAAPAAAPAPEP